MSSPKFSNLREILQGDMHRKFKKILQDNMNRKLMEGVVSRDFIDLSCDATTRRKEMESAFMARTAERWSSYTQGHVPKETVRCSTLVTHNKS